MRDNIIYLEKDQYTLLPIYLMDETMKMFDLNQCDSLSKQKIAQVLAFDNYLATQAIINHMLGKTLVIEAPRIESQFRP